MKFFYLGHGVMSYECLKDLLERGYKPAFVVIHKDLEYERLCEMFYDPMNALCSENSIPLYPVEKIFSVHNEIASCDVGVCLGFMEILKKETLDLPKHGIINVHGGKLPQYRGRAPISRAIMNGEKFFTLTLHKMDEGVDSGDVCLETAMPITDKDNLNTVYEKCSAETAPLVERYFNAFKRGMLDCKKQDLANSKPFRKITDEERKIDWNKGAREIFNLIRALIPPFPGAFFEYNGKRYHALASEIMIDNGIGKPGEILFIDENSTTVKCGDGSIYITSIADDSLNPITIIDNFHKGDILV
jgi:methionyl-tRNA formyltransferase